MSGMAGRKVIAIETSSRSGSVAVAERGALLASRALPPENRNTVGLLPAIEQMFGELGWRPGDLQAVYYSHGPGSFTGLRVAATTARMLQWSCGCLVAAVPTLEVIARNALRLEGSPVRIAAILDARRGMVFAGLFERQGSNGLRTLEDAALRDPAAWLASIEGPFCITGEGVERHRQACDDCGGEVLDAAYWRPTAENVLYIGERLAAQGRWSRPEEITPLYMRPPEAEEVYEQRRAEARRRRGE